MQNSQLPEEEIRALLATKSETRNLEYKEKLNWGKDSHEEKSKIVKDILAMFNTQDGGKIIFGVENKQYELKGLSEDDFNCFDQTKVNDYLHKFTDPKYSCQVYKNIIDGRYIVTIDVPEFNEVPIICKDDAYSVDNKKQILKKGQVYIRTEKGTSEAVPSSEEMRELLGRAIAKKGNELLSQIERLIKGKPPKGAKESEKEYEVEIEETKGFLIEKIGDSTDKYGFIDFQSFPLLYDPKRISDALRIKALIRNSEVRLRGWPVPNTDEKNSQNFLKGRESFSNAWRSIEAYRAYQSGLFIWRVCYSEDVEGKSSEGKPVLDYLGVILMITEYFLFLKRFYEQIPSLDNLGIRIDMHRNKERRLVSLYRPIRLTPFHISNESIIPIRDDIRLIDLSISYKEIAAEIVKKIFSVFNLNLSESDISEWQMKLIEKRL